MINPNVPFTTMPKEKGTTHVQLVYFALSAFLIKNIPVKASSETTKRVNNRKCSSFRISTYVRKVCTVNVRLSTTFLKTSIVKDRSFRKLLGTAQ